MKIAILSDTRLPTNINYPGHGLGRSIARIGTGLAARGHDVTVYAGYFSGVDGCKVIEDTHEDQRSYSLAAQGMSDYDVVLDGSHHFGLSILLPDLPVVCKVADGEGVAPRNRVYGDKTIPVFFKMEQPGLVIPEGVDVDNIPFVPGGRGDHLLFASALWKQKRPELAVEVARKAGVPIWIMGERHGDEEWGEDRYIEPQAGAAFYDELAKARGVVYPQASMVTLEAAATGTPGISGLEGDDWVEEGVTGFIRPSVEEAAEAVKFLDGLDKKAMREWVCDNRSVAVMAAKYERALERAANGELW